MGNPIPMVRPSGSHEWFYCAGSQAMQKDQPNDDSDDTREGIAAHWIGSERLIPFVKGAELKTDIDFKDKLAPNDVFIDGEMLDGVSEYVSDVLQYCNDSGSLHMLHVEEKIDLGHLYPGMSGTPDCWVYNPSNHELVIWDFKYGHGHVEAFENPQLMIYIWGILKLLGIHGGKDEWLTVRLRIVQPRSYHSGGPMREWVLKASDLRGYFNQLKLAAELAMRGDGNCTPGPHCRHCARHLCSTLQGTGYNIIDVIKGVEPIELSGASLSFELKLLRRASKLLEFRLTAVNAQMESELNSDHPPPGFALEKKFGRKRWKKKTPIAKVLAFTDAMEVDIRKPENLDTPTQTLKKFNDKAKELGIDKLDASIIDNYIETPFTGYNVVEFNEDYLRQAFGNTGSNDNDSN